MLKEQFSFPKSKRLLNKNDFLSLRQGSRFLVSGILLCYFKENNSDHSRLGIAVSKKFGNAVLRNTFKRHIREKFRHSRVEGNFDFLIVPNLKKIKSNKIDHQEVFTELPFAFSEVVKKMPIVWKK